MSNFWRGALLRAAVVALLFGLVCRAADAVDPIRARRINGNPYPNIAAQFVAANSQYASLTNMTSLQVGNTDDFTIAGWANLDAIGGAYALLAKGDLANNSEYNLFYNGGVGWRFRVYSAASSATVSNTTGGIRTAGAWDFIVAWHDQAANTINIAINGGATDSASKGAISITAGTGSIRLGANQAGAALNSFMDGRLDCVGFWKGRILSAADRTQLYNNGKGMAYRDLDGGLKANLSCYFDLNGNFIDANGVAIPMTNNNGVSFAAGKR